LCVIVSENPFYGFVLVTSGYNDYCKDDLEIKCVKSGKSNNIKI